MQRKLFYRQISEYFISDKNYLRDYLISDKIFRIFSVLWILYIVRIYESRIHFPKELFFPKFDFQLFFLADYPSRFYFYTLVIIGIVSSLFTLKRNKIIYRILTLFSVLWLNAFLWSFGSISHSGHLFVLTHFFSIFLVYHKKIRISSFNRSINFYHLGLLSTYTLAGLWKLVFLIKDTFIPKVETTTWFDPEAVKTNAIINLLGKEIIPKGWELEMYNIPVIWQIAVLGTFFIQLIAVSALFSRRLKFVIIAGLIGFHIYNQLFTGTYFLPAIFTLLIVFFPYHLFLRNGKI